MPYILNIPAHKLEPDALILMASQFDMPRLMMEEKQKLGKNNAAHLCTFIAKCTVN